jgi:AmmeMemoRadiSam system protein A
VEPAGPLSDTLARCAAAAALEDPRFPPVGPQEIPELEIELSLLSRPEPVMPEQIEPGRHGLLVRQGFRSGLLLPQVAARYAWSAQRFLEETCIKAGLERDAWRDPATRVYAFTAEVFSEADFRAAGEAAS